MPNEITRNYFENSDHLEAVNKRVRVLVERSNSGSGLGAVQRWKWIDKKVNFLEPYAANGTKFSDNQIVEENMVTRSYATRDHHYPALLRLRSLKPELIR